MLRKRSTEGICYGIFGLCQCLGCIAANNVTGLAEVSFGMYLRRVLSLCVRNASYRLQLLVIDFHQFLCLFQNLFILSNHQADGIAEAAGGVTFRDHHIPVLLNMSDLVVRNIRCSQDTQNTRQGFCLGSVNL